MFAEGQIKIENIKSCHKQDKGEEHIGYMLAKQEGEGPILCPCFEKNDKGGENTQKSQPAPQKKGG